MSDVDQTDGTRTGIEVTTPAGSAKIRGHDPLMIFLIVVILLCSAMIYDMRFNSRGEHDKLAANIAEQTKAIETQTKMVRVQIFLSTRTQEEKAKYDFDEPDELRRRR